ncbi:MAG: type II toxin-antitoxin system VapC family toxin [Alphaproteobacteria bacterium]
MRGWLLDSNVIAELARPKGDPKVVAWAMSAPEETFFISVVTLAEYDKGIAALPTDVPQRSRYAAALAALEARFAGRVLSLGDAVARRWGRISGEVRRATGRTPPVIDTLLAATAIEHDLCLVTRNVKDVRATGALVLDPWRV